MLILLLCKRSLNCLKCLRLSSLGGAHEEMQRPERDTRELGWNKGVCKARRGHSKIPCIVWNKHKEGDVTSAAGYKYYRPRHHER